MEKLKMQTTDKVDTNIEMIGKLFPNVITERINENGILEHAIDFDLLKQELSKEIVDTTEERYQFSWPEKKKHMRLAGAPISATLRPCREESVNFDTTQNLYIEGDNLDVLKLLQETYLGKVKMIYIDPPYNTGNDFVYNDSFKTDREEWDEMSGDYDEQGNRLFKNTDSNGRFHTDWLNMIYPRIKVAKDLLADDGVIFISIDDNEVENLKRVCNEIFGEQNFVAQFVWERAFAPKNDAKYVSNSHDYVVMFAKNITDFQIGRLPRTAEADARYSNPDNDPRGAWASSDISVKTYSAENDYPITTPSGKIVEPPAARCWSLSKNKFLERLQDGRIWFGADGNGVPRIKRFLSELKFDGMVPTSLLFHKEVGHSQEGAKEVTFLLKTGAFDGPKPVRLLKHLLKLATRTEHGLHGQTRADTLAQLCSSVSVSDSQCSPIILDFFSGSASTAHAVMQLNAEDGGNRKYICVQLPELTDTKSTAYKAGYKNICEIGKERIRRAGAKIANENAITAPNLDIGFRVLKLDSSNMKDVYYNPNDLTQDDFSNLVSNIKEDRTAEDLLLQVMLDLGVLLSSSIEESIIAGKKVFNVADNFLIACFDENITEETVSAIAKQTPYYAVFRDSSLANDSVATNFDQIFATYSPDTVRRVL